MAQHTPAFHLFLPQMRMSHDAIVERALAAEAVGFEGISFMDHLAPPLAGQQDMWEAMSIAAWVLAKTSTLIASHLVLCDSMRHPAVLAKQATSLDHASAGRFELGIGWGSVSAELETFGVGSVLAADRVRRLDESLDVMRRLWSGEVVDHAGDWFNLGGAQQNPAPTRHIPITIGGVGKKTLDLVRRHADWWNVPVHELEKLDELRDSAGRARVSIQTMVALVSDDAGRAEASALVTKRFGATKMAQNILVGTASELTDRFADWNARGVERFHVWFADFAQLDTLERFGHIIAAAGAGR